MSTEAPSGEAMPQGPTKLSRGHYVAALKRTAKQVKEDDLSGLAAGVAFRIFLSLFPAAFAGLAIFGLVYSPQDIQALLQGLQGGVIPTSALEDVLLPLVQGDSSRQGFAVVAGIGAGLLAATSAATSLMRALCGAYDVPETRKFIRLRVIGLLLSLALLVALAVLIVLLVAGPQLQEALLPGAPVPVEFVLALARGLLAIAVLIALFAFVYWVGPDRERPQWQWMSPGAIVGVLAWLLASVGFTVYVQTFGNYAETYGALAGVVVLLLWLQYSMLAILVGAELNAEVERAARGASAASAATTPSMRAMRTGGPPGPQARSPMTVDSVPPGARRGPKHLAAGANSGRGRLAGVTAGLMALAVFLGFAKRRADRT